MTVKKRVVAALVLSALLGSCANAPARREPLPRPAFTHAVWVVRTDLVDRGSVDRVLAEARAGGFDTLIVQVRGRGDAYYSSRLEPAPPALAGSAFDPLARLLRGAYQEGLRVHAWVNANLVYDPDDPNRDPRHVVQAHPEWLSLPDQLAPRAHTRPAREMVEPLLAYTRARRRSLEGLYGEPGDPAWRAHVTAVCRDLVRRYPVDGLHLDYIRYPNTDFGYSVRALDVFRREVNADLDGAEVERLERRRRQDPLIYTRMFPRRWTRFRREAVSRIVEQVAAACRNVRPGIEISAAVFPDPAIARGKVLQDWTVWLREGRLDVACPMNYTTDRTLFETRSRAVLESLPPSRIWMGIGAWRLEPEETVSRMRMVKGMGGGGCVLFSLGGLRERPGSFEALREAVRP